MGWLWREVLIKKVICTATTRLGLASPRFHSQEAVASLPTSDQTLTPAPFPKEFSNSSATRIAKPLLGKLTPFCVGIVCTSATGAIAICASDHRAIAAVPDGSTIFDTTNDATASFFQATPLIQALEQDSLPHLTHETSLQAQNTPTTPPLPPGNLQPNPNEDRFLQPSPTPAPVTPDSTPPVQPSPTPSPPVQPSPTPQTPTPSNPRPIQVQKIQVTGSTVFSLDQLKSIVQSYEGRSLTVEQLREVADKITQLYLDRGYITSRAILVDQAITEGTVEIRVLEGSLEEIRIEGTRRLNPNYIRKRVQLGAKAPLNTAQLEDQLRLLRADPLFENVEASLRAGTRLGQSILIVRVVEANPFEGSVGIDNYSPPSVGSERLGINLLYRNLTGNGDAIATSYNHTTRSGADDVDVSYRFPVNAMNGAVQLRTAFTWNKIVDQSFSFFDIQGDSQLYEISFQQPLVRSPREEFSLSLGFTHQISKAVAGPFPISPGANSEGITTTSVIKFAQDYIRRDVKGAWSVRSLFSFGTGLLGATTNTAPVPDGQFFSWLGQVQRVQVLNSNNFLIVGADIQLTPNSLVPSQQFVIGGGQSLRGYRQNIRAGDNGVRFTIEDRITLERDESGAATFQLAPFFDAGVVWNVSDNPSPLPSQRFLAGLGLGIIWEPVPRLNLRLDYGYPLIDLDDRGKNAQDEGFYFSVRYRF
ncbi:MAG TPA: peptide ABC transporter permease [Cyanobacteria bacterium UBA8553]|nr:peptide ABC transporter permease [Cyanobacteria bacterium UBA8553]